MIRLEDDFWNRPPRLLHAVPRRGWTGRRRAIAWAALRWLATLAVYVLICVEIIVAVVLFAPAPR